MILYYNIEIISNIILYYDNIRASHAVARLPPAPATHVRRRRQRRWARRAYILYYISMCIIGKPSIRNTTIFIRLPSAAPEYTKIQYKSVGARARVRAGCPPLLARTPPAAIERLSAAYRRTTTFRPQPPPPILAAIGGGWPPMTRSRTHTPIPINRSAAAVYCARRMTTLFFPPSPPRHTFTATDDDQYLRRRRRRHYSTTAAAVRYECKCERARLCVCGRSPAAAPPSAHRYRRRPTRPTGFRSLHPRTDFPSCSNGTPHPVLSAQTPPRYYYILLLLLLLLFAPRALLWCNDVVRITSTPPPRSVRLSIRGRWPRYNGCRV